jgi:Initiator Rep protein, WH2/Initiator Replication protein, WH1
VSRAIEQKNTHDGFVKPGELIDIRAGADLSLQDRRIFNLLIENAWAEIGEDKPHRIAMNRLRGLRHRGSERVADSVKTLMTTLVEVPTMLEGQPAIFTTQLCGETTRVIDEDSPNAVLVYNFPKGLRRIIQDSRYWGRIKAYVMFAFTSKYALALYEAVCLRGNLRVSEQRFSVDEFRALLGVEDGKLPLFKNLKKWALDPAVSEVNALSDFNVEIEPIREGGPSRGKLTGFRLRWEKKSPDDWRAVLDELLRSKVGRKARIRGTVETIAL